MLSNALALAYYITPLQYSSVGPVPLPVACLPYAQEYSTSPTLPQLCAASCKTSPPPIFLFIPLQSGGGVAPLLPILPSLLRPVPRPSLPHLDSVSAPAAWTPPPPPLPPPPPTSTAFAEDKLEAYFSRLCKRHSTLGLFVGVSESQRGHTTHISICSSHLNIVALCYS